MRDDRWNKSEDAVLLEAIKAHGGIRAAARALGISENAAIARHNRIRGKVFPCDKERRAAVKRQRQERRFRNSELIRLMQRSIDHGVSRNSAIRVARMAGAPLQAIGDHFGLTRERVRQIAEVRP